MGGGSPSWSEEVDEVVPTWEEGSRRAPSWDDPDYWAKCDLEVKLVRKPVRVRRAKVKSLKRTLPDTSKKQITYPHLVKLEDWLTLMKEHDVVERLKSIKAHIAKEDIKQKTRLVGQEEEGMKEAELAAKVSITDRGARIVMIKKRGVTQYYVVVHMMGPITMSTKFTPWVEKEQTKEKTVDGQLRGVEQEVINLRN